MILDTNALSAFIDGEPAVGVRLSSEAHVAIPVIVLGEFRYGIAGSRYRDEGRGPPRRSSPPAPRTARSGSTTSWR